MSILLSDYGIDESEWSPGEVRANSEPASASAFEDARSALSSSVVEEHEQEHWPPNPYQAVAEAQVRAGAWPGTTMLLEARRAVAGLAAPFPPRQQPHAATRAPAPGAAALPAQAAALQRMWVPQPKGAQPRPTALAPAPQIPPPKAPPPPLRSHQPPRPQPPPPKRQPSKQSSQNPHGLPHPEAALASSRQVPPQPHQPPQAALPTSASAEWSPREETHVDLPWNFLFEFAEPEKGQSGGCGDCSGCGGGLDSTDDTDDEFDWKECTESVAGSGFTSSAHHTEAASSCSGGWMLSHRAVPKSTDLRAMSTATGTSSCHSAISSATASSGVTTLMLRNIPNIYTRTQLAQELDSLGFARLYDFLYLPIDKWTQWNVGYAFVNFVNSAAASKCVGVMTDYVFKCFEHHSGKVTQVAVAHIQGLERNLAYYSKTAVQLGHRSNRPLVCATSSRSSATSEGKARRRRRGKPARGRATAQPQADDSAADGGSPVHDP